MQNHRLLSGAQSGRHGGRQPDRSSLERVSQPYFFIEDLNEQDHNETGHWRVLARHKLKLTAVACAGVLAAVLFSLTQPPVYQVTTSLEIQNLNDNFLNFRDLNPTANGGGAYSPDYDLQTNGRVLESRALIERAIAQDGIEKRFAGTLARKPALPWLRFAGFGTPAAPPDREAVLAAAQAAVKARVQPNTRVIELSVDASDAGVAADMANAIAAEFIESSIEKRWNSTQHTGEWLTRQMENLKAKLERSQAELQRYARASNLVFTSEKDNVAEDRLRQLQQELSKAQADRVARQSFYELLANGRNDSLPEVLDDPALKEYQVELTNLRRQLADLSSSFTPAYPKVTKLKAQIAAVETALAGKRESIAARLRNEYEAARRREQLLAGQYDAQVRTMADQSDRVAHYNILKREVDTTRQLYDSMFQRVKEAGVASALRASNIQVIDPARPSRYPYKPRVALNCLVGFSFALFAGCALIIVRERSNKKVKGPGDISSLLGLPELGVIPAAEGNGYSRRLLRPGLLSTGGKGAGKLELEAWQKPLSPVAEAFRVTLTSILFTGTNGTRPRTLVVSSPDPAAGKTTVASNLAIGLAQAGRRVLLVDGDLRRPRLHSLYDIENTHGLSDVLAGSSPLTVRETRIPNLFLLPSGSGGDANVLFAQQLPELFGRLRSEFDIVLVDSPPLLQMPDARLLARHSDGLILVVRSDKTSHDAAGFARERLEDDGIPLIGVIVTAWNPKSPTEYSYLRYQSDYYHRTSA